MRRILQFIIVSLLASLCVACGQPVPLPGQVVMEPPTKQQNAYDHQETPKKGAQQFTVPVGIPNYR